MKRLVIHLLVIALVLTAVVALHRRKQQGPAQREELESVAVMSVGDGVKLGTLAADPEGGVRITVERENGRMAAYLFRDVEIDSWYADAVNFVVSAGLMTGPGEDPYFQPEYGMTRESFAAIIYRFAHGSPEPGTHTFQDVDPNQWYVDSINWVVNRRIMTGADEGIFGVGKYLTCEQALIGLYRLAGEPDTDGDLTDYPYVMKVSDFGRNAVDWAWKQGLITEVECVWYPTQAISRGQVALLLTRYSRMAGAANQAEEA